VLGRFIAVFPRPRTIDPDEQGNESPVLRD
jgi:hypothetical protein